MQSSPTKAELEALLLMCEGKTTGQAANELGISLSAMKQRLNRGKVRLGAKTLVQAAYMLGKINPSKPQSE